MRYLYAEKLGEEDYLEIGVAKFQGIDAYVWNPEAVTELGLFNGTMQCCDYNIF